MNEILSETRHVAAARWVVDFRQLCHKDLGLDEGCGNVEMLAKNEELLGE